ncbi:unnamed protein product [Thelazia callipaeda]|uniref:Gemin6_C domain-containing protein n=1 Tax=Thelazia callipaeda TaxID=103827 RepID=A0A0N5CUX0_THECL|nr:unnamed protein product [Thelazia callipaeda]
MKHICASSFTDLSIPAMYDLCGEPVAVDLINDKTICGNIFTFDPVNYSLAVIVFSKEKEPIALKIIFEKSAKQIRKFDAGDQLPDGCIKRTSDLDGWLGNLFKTTPKSTKHQLERCLIRFLFKMLSIFWHEQKRQQLIEWLEQNQVQVTNNSDGSISLFNMVRIVEPFTSEDCFCDKPVILSRVKKLLEKIPKFNASGT